MDARRPVPRGDATVAGFQRLRSTCATFYLYCDMGLLIMRSSTIPHRDIEACAAEVPSSSPDAAAPGRATAVRASVSDATSRDVHRPLRLKRRTIGALIGLAVLVGSPRAALSQGAAARKPTAPKPDAAGSPARAPAADPFDTPAAATARTATCPAPATQIRFAQVMHAAFVADLVGCDIRTRAVFVSLAVPTSNADPNYVVFLARAPGSGQPTGETVVRVSKPNSAPVFKLAAGQAIVLSGGTELGFPAPGSNAFLADSVVPEGPQTPAPAPIVGGPAAGPPPAPEPTVRQGVKRAFYGYFMTVPGVAGPFSNTAAGATPIATGAVLAVGKSVQYQLGFGYIHWGTANGFDLDVATLGFPIQIYDGAVRVAAVPTLQLLDWDFLINGGSSAGSWLMAWHAGAGTQFTVERGAFFGMVSPFNAQVRYLMMSTSAIEPKFGLNWPVRFGAGLRF